MTKFLLICCASFIKSAKISCFWGVDILIVYTKLAKNAIPVFHFCKFMLTVRQNKVKIITYLVVFEAINKTIKFL